MSAPFDLPAYLEPELETELQQGLWRYEAMTSGELCIAGLPILPGGGRRADGLHTGFLHVVTTTVEVRRVDRERIATVGRAWALLEALSRGDEGVHWWRESDRFFVAPTDFSALVVLGRAGRGLCVVTAYPVGKATRQLALSQRCAESWARGETRANSWRSLSTTEREHPAWGHRVEVVAKWRCRVDAADEDATTARRAARRARRVARGQE